MSKHTTCYFCGQPATVHLTQIVGNNAQKLDMCEACAQQKAGLFADNAAAPLAAFLAKALAGQVLAQQPPQEAGLVCRNVDLSLRI